MRHQNYGWASQFPLSTLTVSGTAQREGLSNQPDTSEQEANLSRLSDFLARVPFPFTVSSAYRSYQVNTAVGGARTSQHMNGLALDIVPTSISNKRLAEWFYNYKDDFPELDQVIWYHDTNHLHVGICPTGASGCSSSRWEAGGTVKRHLNGIAKSPEFFSAKKEGSVYVPWAPSGLELAKQAALFAANRPLKTVGAAVVLWSIAATGVVVTTLGVMWLLRKRGVL